MEIADDGFTTLVPERRPSERINLPMTKEEFEAAYVMWCCGGAYRDIALAYHADIYTLAWCLIMRKANKLDGFNVHYRLEK